MTDAQETTTGARLRTIRQARELSQHAIARMAGVSRQAVSDFESGLSDPSLRVALLLSRALGMSVEELFGPANPAPPIPVRPVAPPGGDGARVTHGRAQAADREKLARAQPADGAGRLRGWTQASAGIAEARRLRERDQSQRYEMLELAGVGGDLVVLPGLCLRSACRCRRFRRA